VSGFLFGCDVMYFRDKLQKYKYRLRQLLKGFCIPGSELITPEHIRNAAGLDLLGTSMLGNGLNLDIFEFATSVEV
jgi:hypothetical protein